MLVVSLLQDILEELRDKNADNRLWDVKDVSKYLKVSERVARNLIKEADFPPPLMIGKSMRWHSDDIKKYAKRQRL